MDITPFVRTIHDYLVPHRPGSYGHGGLGKTVKNLLLACSNESMKAQDLYSIITGNRAYAHFIMSMPMLSARMTDWREEKMPSRDFERVIITRILGLLGKSAVRNTVVSIRLNRIADFGLPKKKNEMVKIATTQQLKFSLFAEEFCVDQHYIHPDQAFLAGVHYDWLGMIMNRRGASREVKNYLDDVFREGLRTAIFAYTLGTRLKKTPKEKELFASGLLLPIGKMLMALMFPREHPSTWIGFLNDVDLHADAKVDALINNQLPRYPVTSFEMSGVFIDHLQLFRHVEPAIRLAHSPYLVESSDPELSDLAVLLGIANRVVQLELSDKPADKRRPDETVAFLFDAAQVAWLANNKISFLDLQKIQETIKNRGKIL